VGGCERHSLLEKDISAISFEALWDAVDLVDVVEVIVSPSVRRVSDASTGVSDRKFESTLERTKRSGVAKVPAGLERAKWSGLVSLLRAASGRLEWT
jgi:hypothetical protein